jgi:hypothetical protein
VKWHGRVGKKGSLLERSGDILTETYSVFLITKINALKIRRKGRPFTIQ